MTVREREWRAEVFENKSDGGRGVAVIHTVRCQMNCTNPKGRADKQQYKIQKDNKKTKVEKNNKYKKGRGQTNCLESQQKNSNDPLSHQACAKT